MGKAPSGWKMPHFADVAVGHKATARLPLAL